MLDQSGRDFESNSDTGDLDHLLLVTHGAELEFRREKKKMPRFVASAERKVSGGLLVRREAPPFLDSDADVNAADMPVRSDTASRRACVSVLRALTGQVGWF
jgi:hypothetical protein